jgi:hypothetical protein
MIGATRTWATLARRRFGLVAASDRRLLDVDTNRHLGKPVALIVNRMAPNIKRARAGHGTIGGRIRLPSARTGNNEGGGERR